MASPSRKKPLSTYLLSGVAVAFILLVVSPIIVVAMVFASEPRGPYHSTTAIADLEGDGDLDVVLMNLRYESESAIWHQVTLWTNQGDGTFRGE